MQTAKLLKKLDADLPNLVKPTLVRVGADETFEKLVKDKKVQLTRKHGIIPSEYECIENENDDRTKLRNKK